VKWPSLIEKKRKNIRFTKKKSFVGLAPILLFFLQANWAQLNYSCPKFPNFQILNINENILWQLFFSCLG
jgi:hypothetical protein